MRKDEGNEEHIYVVSVTVSHAILSHKNVKHKGIKQILCWYKSPHVIVLHKFWCTVHGVTCITGMTCIIQ